MSKGLFSFILHFLYSFQVFQSCQSYTFTFSEQLSFFSHMSILPFLIYRAAFPWSTGCTNCDAYKWWKPLHLKSLSACAIYSSCSHSSVRNIADAVNQSPLLITLCAVYICDIQPVFVGLVDLLHLRVFNRADAVDNRHISDSTDPTTEGPRCKQRPSHLYLQVKMKLVIIEPYQRISSSNQDQMELADHRYRQECYHARISKQAVRSWNQGQQGLDWHSCFSYNVLKVWNQRLV